eukprot:TRINITY_DN4607_c0_g2_i2.p1 TRINITY_DN4607_c0_g2~~TRINITY_DN4607_c0_g2_i2.p1  ORF type:complete len:1933 (-),score=471.29 TRINITY_DN4607_c0_g2_i2:6-5228(-)
MANLSLFNAASNQFSGSIPFYAGAFPLLSSLILTNNSLSGTLPDLITSLTALRYLDVSNNSLSGSLPAGLAAQTGLISLGLCHNYFTAAAYPSAIAAIPGATICLAGNYFDGTQCPMPACQPCPAGSYFASNNVTKSPGACLGCGPGTYGTVGTTSCTNCLPGTYRNVSYGTVPSDCFPCTQGHYCNNSAHIQPLPCPLGSASAASGANSIATCVSCTIGSYAHQLGMVQCIQCPPGSSTQSSGATSPSDCQTSSVTAIFPSGGPQSGGQTVTVVGSFIGNGADITSVSICSVSASIQAQTASTVTVTTGSSGSFGICSVSVSSTNMGTNSLLNSYTYNAPGVITTVSPSSGPQGGGMIVTISGSSLGNGTDITAVTFGGVSAVIQSQSVTQLVVVTPAQSVGAVAVSVRSILNGISAQTNAYTFNPALVVSSFQPTTLSTLASNRVITFSGSNLASTDIQVTVGGVAAAVLSRSPSTMIVQLQQPTAPVSASIVLTSTQYGGLTVSTPFIFTADFVIRANGYAQTEGTALQLFVSLSASPVTLVSTNVSLVGCSYQTMGTRALIFNSTLWSVNRTIAITADRNYIATGNQICAVQFSPIVSTDVLFAGVSATVNISYIDVDVAGIAISNGTLRSAGQDFQIVEGNAATLNVVLTSKPLTDVTLSLSSLAPEHIVIDTTSMTFTPALWNVTQQLSLHSPIDNIATGPLWISVNMAIGGSDPKYATMIAPQINLLMVDFDAIGAVQFSPALRNTTEDGGIVELFAIVTRVVTADIVVTAVSSDVPNGGTVSPVSVNIPLNSILQPYTFTVTGATDFIARPDVAYSVTFAATNGFISESVTIPLWNTNVDVAGFNMSSSLLVVNETGAPVALTVSIASKPMLPLVMSLQPLLPRIVLLSANTLRWTSANWNLPQTVTVSGLVNPVHNVSVDQVVNVSVSALTGDQNYLALAAQQVTVVNVDIHWPIPSAVTPELLPQIGREFSMSGDFLDNVTIWLGNQPCVNTTVDMTNHNVSTVMLPLNVTGYNFTRGVYHNISILNPDGGFYFWFEPVFITDSCPYVGFWGIGLDCKNCPVGGICPGGYRVWPQAGWWTESEFFVNVQQCYPSVACLGGRFSECAEGYEGRLCGTCKDGFYRDRDDLCYRCQSQTLVAILFLIQFAFLGVFVLVAAFLSDSRLSSAAFVVSNLRGLWIVTAGVSNVPIFVEQILNLLSLLAADLSFSQPGCAGVSTFVGIWAVNLGAVGAAFIALLLILVIQYLLRRRGVLRGVQHFEKDNMSLHTMRAHFMVHVGRVVFCFLMFVFAILFVKSLQAFDCIDDGTGRIVLFNDVSVECFKGEHIPVFLISLVLFAGCLFLLGFTTYLAFATAMGKKQRPLLAGIAIAVIDDFSGRSRAWANMVFSTLDIALAVVSIALNFYDNWLFIATLIILAVGLTFALVVRPFAETWMLVAYIIVNAAAVIATLLPLWDSMGQTVCAYILVSLMLLYFVMLMGVLWEEVRKRIRGMPRIQAEDLDEQLMRLVAWDEGTELQKLKDTLFESDNERDVEGGGGGGSVNTPTSAVSSANSSQRDDHKSAVMISADISPRLFDSYRSVHSDVSPSANASSATIPHSTSGSIPQLVIPRERHMSTTSDGGLVPLLTVNTTPRSRITSVSSMASSAEADDLILPLPTTALQDQHSPRRGVRTMLPTIPLPRMTDVDATLPNAVDAFALPSALPPLQMHHLNSVSEPLVHQDADDAMKSQSPK